MLQTVECLFEQKDFAVEADAGWRVHPNLFCECSIQKRSFDVQLLKVEVVHSGEGENETEGIIPGDRCESFVIVNSRLLTIALDD